MGLGFVNRKLESLDLHFSTNSSKKCLSSNYLLVIISGHRENISERQQLGGKGGKIYEF